MYVIGINDLKKNNIYEWLSIASPFCALQQNSPFRIRNHQKKYFMSHFYVLALTISDTQTHALMLNKK